MAPSKHPHPFAGPALALVDVGDIPRGLRTLDVLVKEAEVQIHATGTVQPGRYLLLFGGAVEPTRRSLQKALRAAGDTLCDHVLLADAEERILPALIDGTVRWPAPGDTLGVLQTGASPTLLRAVDSALKGALVDLIQLRVADGLGGRAVATLWGETHDVEAAIELAEQAFAQGDARSASTEVIRRADPEVAQAIQPASGFFKEWRG